MKIGLSYLPNYWPEVHGSEGNLYRDILEEVEFADQAGFESVWFAEHHFFAYGGLIPSVPMLGLAAALRTKRIRIGSGIVCIPLHDPLRVAEECAMLDVLSGGRFEFGIGRAFQKAEYDAFNVDMADSRVLFEEAHAIILNAWTRERFSYEGKFRTIPDVQIIPKPVQRPHPPITVACMLTRESFEWTGARGYNLSFVAYVSTVEDCQERIGWYHDALRNAGHDLEGKEIMTGYHFYLGETAQQAKEYAEPFLTRYLRSAAESNRADAYSKEYQGYAGIGKFFETVDYHYMYPERVIFGDVDQCIQRLKDIEALGITRLCLLTNFGGMPHREIMDSLERFATHVLPHFPSAERDGNGGVKDGRKKPGKE